MPSLVHLTARMSPLSPPLHHEDTGTWLWQHLRETFLQALAVTLMPDHPHLVITDDHDAPQRLARLLGQFGRTFGIRGRAASIADPEPIRSQAAALRHVRYIALNPCRASLVRCPLAWPWSTHRDVIGACTDPWITATRLAAALGVPRRGFEARHHAYVSGDPHASVVGTPMPRAAPTVEIPIIPLQLLVDAVAAATRTPGETITRRGRPRALLVALARDQGWHQTSLLARVAGCSHRAIQRLPQCFDTRALEALRLCAGDPRLRRLPPRDQKRGVRVA
jgi:REP element-mobilizing transposase RayT/antitoxin (DNA-binding transcriptional repressor) of toxin-antitoxin stability system